MNQALPQSAMPTASDPQARRLARLAAVQGLYRLALSEATPRQVIDDFRRDPHALLNDVAGGDAELAKTSADQSLFGSIINGVTQDVATLDDMIAGAVDAKFSVARLEVLLRAILRAGALELHRHTDTAAGIIINDYVDVAHAFYNAKEPGLVNAILDRLGKKLRGS